MVRRCAPAKLLRIVLGLWHALVWTSVVAQPTTQHGLQATYYRGQDLRQAVFSTVDAELDFNWQEQPPLPQLSANDFSVRWTGFVRAPVTGRYTFRTIADDGLRVWLDGHLLVDDWQNHGATLHTAARTLTAGTYYALRVEYYQANLRSRVYLGWDVPGERWNFTPLLLAHYGPSAPLSPLPTRYLYTPAPVARLRPPLARPAGPVVAAPVVAPLPVSLATPQTQATARRRPPARARAARSRRPPPALAQPAVTFSPMTALPVGRPIQLQYLLFVQSKAQMLPTSQPELASLVQWLRAHPTVRLVIAGHTDNVGDSLLNRRLSTQRANVVRAYLVQQGIDSLRLQAVGYGGSHPIANNADPSQRARNRRVEITPLTP